MPKQVITNPEMPQPHQLVRKYREEKTKKRDDDDESLLFTR